MKNTNNGKMTYKQGSLLFGFTKLKFWEPSNPPPPTMAEASSIIDHCIQWLNITTGKVSGEALDALREQAEAIILIRKWFPDYSGPLSRPYHRSKKKAQASESGQAEERKPAAPAPAPETAADDLFAEQGDLFSAARKAQADAVKAHDKAEREARKAQDAARKAAELAEKAKADAEAAAERARRDAEREAEAARKAAEQAKAQAEAAAAAEKAREAAAKAESSEDPTAAMIIKMIMAGVDNIMLVGPAGCGKTTITQMVADALAKPCTVISCSFGTPAAEFVGERFPEPRGTRFGAAYGADGIVCLDEFTTLDPSVGSVVNASLANGEINTTTGNVKRRAVIVATANTTGDGSDRKYVANNQLDIATLDRFAGCVIKVDYNRAYEKRFDPEVVEYVERMRDAIDNRKVRRVASTRAIINGEKLKKAGLDWRGMLTACWTDAEKANIY